MYDDDGLGLGGSDGAVDEGGGGISYATGSGSDLGLDAPTASRRCLKSLSAARLACSKASA